MKQQAINWWGELNNKTKEKISNFFQILEPNEKEIEKLYIQKDKLINELLCQTFHCDDIVAKKIVDDYVKENEQILLFYDISFLYKI